MPHPVPILETRGLTKEFEGFRAVDRVDLRVAEGSVHALVGPNGAGKTTLFHLLSGFLRPTRGRIVCGGNDLTGRSPERIARLGIARSFQITSLFAQQTPLQHLEVALLAGTGLAHRFWRSDRLLHGFRDRAMDLLGEVGLHALANVPAESMSYGHKRALEIALALSGDPRLLLLDEPTAGMGVEDIKRTIGLIERIRAGRTVVMVEHNMNVVGSLADRVTVLQRGAVLAEGSYEQVRTDPRVITAYLGETDARA